ncbi:C3a anaphylatoxin chemotactic receptor-like isoform X2 [Ambystoma mexicanum]|uniref:C3a anaphylatoxin chemotactic receptor-like isoform X2 n=1 Tax=Ambystoma mexicanum TaxID=8296 RepID=UPI0037E9C140
MSRSLCVNSKDLGFQSPKDHPVSIQATATTCQQKHLMQEQPPNMSSHYNNVSSHAVATSYSTGSMITMAILSLTFLVGLPGNALVIWVTGLKMKHTVNTIWFLNLAIADFLCCLSLPFSIAHVALHMAWPYGDFFCKFLPSIIILNMFASVFILVVISMDRCLLVIKPVWSQNHRTVGLATGLCLGIWFFAFLMCVPVFIYREAKKSHVDEILCLYNYGSHYEDYPMIYYNDDYDLPHTSNPTSHSMMDNLSNTTDFLSERITSYSGMNVSLSATVIPYETSRAVFDHNMWDYELPVHPGALLPLTVTTYTRLIFGFAIPLAIILACYASMFYRVRSAHFSKSRGKMLKVILIIVCAFFISWAPYHVIGVFLLYAQSPTLNVLDGLSQCLAFSNSCINPVLYVFTWQDFKDKVRKSLRSVFVSAFSEDVTRSTMNSRSRNSIDGFAKVTVV